MYYATHLSSSGKYWLVADYQTTEFNKEIPPTANSKNETTIRYVSFLTVFLTLE
jgi:hypothetical protein